MAIRPYEPIRFRGTFVSTYIAYSANPNAGFLPQATLATFKFNHDGSHSGVINRYQAGADDSGVLLFNGRYALTFSPDVQAYQGTIEVDLLNDDGTIRGKQILHAVRVSDDQIKFMLVHSLAPDESLPTPKFPPHAPNGIVQGVMDRVHNPSWHLPWF